MSVYPCGWGVPSSPSETNTIFSIERMVCRVIMFRTTAFMVSEVRPNETAFSPISIMSPCCAEETKLISEISLVTLR